MDKDCESVTLIMELKSSNVCIKLLSFSEIIKGITKLNTIHQESGNKIQLAYSIHNQPFLATYHFLEGCTLDLRCGVHLLWPILKILLHYRRLEKETPKDRKRENWGMLPVLWNDQYTGSDAFPVHIIGSSNYLSFSSINVLNLKPWVILYGSCRKSSASDFQHSINYGLIHEKCKSIYEFFITLHYISVSSNINRDWGRGEWSDQSGRIPQDKLGLRRHYSFLNSVR